MISRVRSLEMVRAGDATVATAVNGAGPALVMLPSYGRDGLEDFDEVADLIAASGTRVLRPQPRGIAGSTGPMQGVTLPNLAQDVAQVIRHLGDGSAVVLGHAFGNIVARVAAVRHPELVTGVILAAASSQGKVDPEINRAPFVVGDLQRPEAERLDVLRRAFFAPGHDPRPWLDGWYPDTLAMQHQAVKSTAVAPYWAGGTVPLLEIIPRCDPFKPQSTWSEMHHQVGDRVETVVIEDASHALFPEQPNGLAETIRAWMAAR